MSADNTTTNDLAPLSRRVTRTNSVPNSIPSDSDEDSQHSDSSNETEEDVCFPMDRQRTRNQGGIDFDEFQTFIDEQRVENAKLLKQNPSAPEQVIFSPRVQYADRHRKRLSKAARKYIPKWLQSSHEEGSSIALKDFETSTDEEEPGPGVVFSEDKNKVEEPSIKIPDRFELFNAANEETIHAHDLSSLAKPGQKIEDLFKSTSTTFGWWLNCCCATDNEIKILAKTFGIHPLTAEDIRMSENREKVEFFKDYYFVAFHSFDSDNESEEFLEPIYFYMVVFKTGILTFHFTPVVHCINVRRRIRQLKDYVPLSSDWICYALIDDITDSFLPVIKSVDFETDAIEASVLVVRDNNISTMLNRIGESRNKVMTLNRLLAGKADVLRMLSKRCHDYSSIPENLTSMNLSGLTALSSMPTGGVNSSAKAREEQATNVEAGQPRGEIALYLGDIQDHVITMYQNLATYEKILGRAYSNYLAQLQVESFNSNNRVTNMLSKVTLIGTVLVPLNIVTGMFGMNVAVPGKDANNLNWWFGILGVLLATMIVGILFANWWIKRINRPSVEEDSEDSQSFISRFIRRNRNNFNMRQNPVRSGNNRSMFSFHI